ncbi:MAG TPA: hypothetical protein VJ776_03845, partial [Thermoanaerobaculia bacterium]|nr:hypothetical protein [Thermoanaerobaculia bacterium]
MTRPLAAAALAATLSTTLFPLPAASAETPQVPPGYYLDSAQVAAPRPVWRDARDGDFTYSVKREFSDSTTA